MLLFYIDESGVAGLTEKPIQVSPFYTLVALAIPSDMWKSMDIQLTTLKAGLKTLIKSEFEIKSSDIRQGRDVFSELRESERVKLFHELADLIISLNSPIFAVRVDKLNLSKELQIEREMYTI